MKRTSVVIFACLLLSPSSFAMSKKNQSAPPPPSPVAETADAIWVGKSDEAKSCGKDRGIDIDAMAAQLQGKGIKILAKKKIPDGKVRIQMCGIDKGDINGYQILKKDLEKAKELGFQAAVINY